MKLKQEIMWPVKGRNLVNLSNSILKTMNIGTTHSSLKVLDKYLSKKEYKNIVVLLYDGMGTSIIDKYLLKNDFLQKNKICNISSVFPATTVSATTSFLTGLQPSEHGWLGWDMFFSDDNETVSVYMNTIKDTIIPSKHIVKERPEMKYKTIIDKINEQTSIKAHIVWAFDKQHPCNTLEEINTRICELCRNTNRNFIYAYYDNLDKILHQYGIESDNTKNEILKLNNMTEKLYYKISSDTLIIVIADHGHIECKYKTLSENKDLFNMLARTTCLEPRACSIKLKNEIDKKNFVKLFLKSYGKEFNLYSKKEIIRKKFFGNKIKHSRVLDNIGDYIAVATKNYCLRYDESGKVFKTYHASITKDEMEIPLIVLKK